MDMLNWLKLFFWLVAPSGAQWRPVALLVLGEEENHIAEPKLQFLQNSDIKCRPPNKALLPFTGSAVILVTRGGATARNAKHEATAADGRASE